MPGAELTLIANVALDRVNGGPASAGGCPTFAPYVFERLGARGVIHTACAPGDRSFFAALNGRPTVDVRFTDAATTSRFDLDYGGEVGETRTMVLHTVGHSWSAGDIDHLQIDTEWVHLAPLARSDFPVAAVARLAARGHRVAYDGQGLVRVPRIGELTFDDRYDRELLRHLTVLKLSEDEAAVLAADAGRERVLQELSAVPELIFTLGHSGAEVHAGGVESRVAPRPVVADVQTTGAGDAFMIGYLVGRHRGLTPTDAAALGAELTASMLADRKGE